MARKERTNGMIRWGIIDDGDRGEESKYIFTTPVTPVQVIGTHGAHETIVAFGVFGEEDLPKTIKFDGRYSVCLVDNRDLRDISSMAQELQNWDVTKHEAGCLDFWARATITTWLMDNGHTGTDSKSLVGLALSVDCIERIYSSKYRKVEAGLVDMWADCLFVPSTCLMCVQDRHDLDKLSETPMVLGISDAIGTAALLGLDLLMDVDEDGTQFSLSGTIGERMHSPLLALANAIMLVNMSSGEQDG